MEPIQQAFEEACDNLQVPDGRSEDAGTLGVLTCQRAQGVNSSQAQKTLIGVQSMPGRQQVCLHMLEHSQRPEAQFQASAPGPVGCREAHAPSSAPLNTALLQAAVLLRNAVLHDWLTLDCTQQWQLQVRLLEQVLRCVLALAA